MRATDPVSGPVLAGDLVVWADERRDGGFDVRSAPIAGGESRRLLTVRGSTTAYYQPRLAASPEVVAVEAIENERNQSEPQTFVGRLTYAGPPSGPLEQVGPRCGLMTTVRPRSIDVFGGELVYRNCERRVEVRRLGSPLPPEQFPGSDLGLRLAGRYVAWVDDGQRGVTVYDRQSGAAAYRLDPEQTGNAVTDIDLRDDGTVVVNPGIRAAAGGLEVASPSAPTLRALAVAGGRAYHPRFVGDAIAFSRSRQSGRPGPGGEAGITTLDGPERVLATGVGFDRYEPTLDFDGRRVAYLVYNCADATIHVVDANSPKRSFGQRRGCPFALSRAARVKRDLRRVLLEPDCFGFEDELCGIAGARLTRGGVLMGRSRDAAPGSDVVLTTRARQTLRRTGRLEVRATGVFQDRGGRRERRTSSITLKRP